MWTKVKKSTIIFYRLDFYQETKIHKTYVEEKIMKTCKKFVVCAAMLMMVCMMLSACGNTVGNIIKAEDGGAEGGIGDTFRTIFFDFSVDSVDYPSEYEGYRPADGYQLLDAVITVKNTFGEELPMYNSDFQIQWHDLGNGDEDYDYGIEMDSSSTVMPSEFGLANGDSCTYHVIYEVPADAKEFSISYLEYFSDETEGDVFFVYFNK